MYPDAQTHTHLASVDINTQFLEDKRGVHTKRFALKNVSGAQQGTITLVLQLVNSMVRLTDLGGVLRIYPRRLRKASRRSGG